MTLVNFGPVRDWRCLAFLLVFVMTKMLLLNIFSGFFIAIFLQFYGRDEVHESDYFQDMQVKKQDIRFEMSKFIVTKTEKILPHNSRNVASNSLKKNN